MTVLSYKNEPGGLADFQEEWNELETKVKIESTKWMPSHQPDIHLYLAVWCHDK